MAPTNDQRLVSRESPDQRSVMRQNWAHLLFLHWKVEADLFQSWLPDGLEIDTFDGHAYLGIVPFFMNRVRPVFLPPVPGLSWFLELNVRTYVHDGAGRSGVYFFSLDCNQAIAVGLARRFFHLPYQHAEMSSHRSGEAIHYSCQRRGQPVSANYVYEPIGPSAESAIGSLEFFLLERYLLFSETPSGKLKVGQVHHSPYLFQAVTLSKYDTAPLEWNGFDTPTEPPVSALYSQGVEVKVFPLETADGR